MKHLSILFLFLANQVFAETGKSQVLNTEIKNVTVFLQGAQVTRQGNLNIKPGRTMITIKSLSPHIDAKSIQVKGIGDFTILSVHHSFNYLDELKNDNMVDSLIDITKSLEHKISLNNNRIAVLNEKLSLLNVNKKLGGESMTASVSELMQAIDFYDKALMEIKSEELTLKDKNHEHQVLLDRIRSEIKDLLDFKEEPTSEIKVRIESDKIVQGKFTVTYLVANAGWFPKYDLRVKDVEQPMQLTYKAELYQNTGVDWNDVKLKFSNANPNQSGVAPELTTWYLNYQRNTIYQNSQSIAQFEPGYVRTLHGRVISGEDGPLPGVNVIIKGTSNGTVTDVDGFYSLTLPNDASTVVFSSVGFESEERLITGSNMNINLIPSITQLSEIVVTGYGGSGERFSSLGQNNYRKPEVAKSVITTAIENQTTMEFEVDKPYTLKSNDENLMVDLNIYEIETIYEYYAVPKLDKDAFLIARIINWEQYNLLEGEANLYFEDTFVGKSVLNARSLQDTLDISLGRDKNIVIGREKVDTFTKKNSLGSNKVETRGFNILVRNKKSQSIHLTLFDQIPVAVINTIEVAPRELSGGKLDELNGEIEWIMDLPPNNQVELNMAYEVKYPKREKVILE